MTGTHPVPGTSWTATIFDRTDSNVCRLGLHGHDGSTSLAEWQDRRGVVSGADPLMPDLSQLSMREGPEDAPEAGPPGEAPQAPDLSQLSSEEAEKAVKSYFAKTGRPPIPPAFDSNPEQYRIARIYPTEIELRQMVDLSRARNHSVSLVPFKNAKAAGPSFRPSDTSINTTAQSWPEGWAFGYDGLNEVWYFYKGTMDTGLSINTAFHQSQSYYYRYSNGKRITLDVDPSRRDEPARGDMRLHLAFADGRRGRQQIEPSEVIVQLIEEDTSSGQSSALQGPLEAFFQMGRSAEGGPGPHGITLLTAADGSRDDALQTGDITYTLQSGASALSSKASTQVTLLREGCPANQGREEVYARTGAGRELEMSARIVSVPPHTGWARHPRLLEYLAKISAPGDELEAGTV